MGIDLYIALAGMLRAGLVATFVDPSNGRDFIERACARLAPSALFASPRALMLGLVSPALRAIPMKFSSAGMIGVRRLATSGASLEVVERDPPDPALVTFTSGSTGAPKAAVRSHGALLAQLDALSSSLDLGEGGVDVETMPIVLLANLAAGVTSVIPGVDLTHPGTVNGARIESDIRRHRATSIVSSPALLERLLVQCAASGRQLTNLRKVFAGGAPVFPSLLDRAARVVPSARVCAVYGSTEAEPIAELDRVEITQADRDAMRSGAGLLAGRPVGAIELRILPNRWGTALPAMSREAFEQMCLPPGDTGEIVVSGPHVLTGYLGGIGDDETKFRVDDAVWHRTGDLGSLEKDGRLWLLGRCAARIEDERGVLYPFAVECAASDAPGVARCALAAVDGQRTLFVEPEQGEPPDSAALQERLAWAQLDEIAFIPKIPVDRRHNAKVDYGALERIIADRLKDRAV
jgi:acyl-CoA synthetase (AMP-forming)/AMP-acid ligase II